jgi:hypothetical protein
MYARDMYTMYLSISISTRRQDAAGQDRSGALRRGRMPCLHWCCRLTTGCALLGCTSCSRAPWEGSPARPSVCSGLGAVSPRHTGRGCRARGACPPSARGGSTLPPPRSLFSRPHGELTLAQPASVTFVPRREEGDWIRREGKDDNVDYRGESFGGLGSRSVLMRMLGLAQLSTCGR